MLLFSLAFGKMDICKVNTSANQGFPVQGTIISCVLQNHHTNNITVKHGIIPLLLSISFKAVLKLACEISHQQWSPGCVFLVFSTPSSLFVHMSSMDHLIHRFGSSSTSLSLLQSHQHDQLSSFLTMVPRHKPTTRACYNLCKRSHQRWHRDLFRDQPLYRYGTINLFSPFNTAKL